MDTRQLAAFCAVVERKSFSQAAERLGVTQPAVSLQIRSLEQRLGRRLLDRSGRRVEPTEAGLRLYASAQRLLQAEEQMLEELESDDDGVVSGTLELGASTGPGGSVVPVLLCEFQERHPDVRARLSVSDTQTVVARVADRELELGIVGAGACPRARSRARDLSRALERPQRDARRTRVRLVRARARPRMIVRWGVCELPMVLAELRIAKPLLVASDRWNETQLGIRPGARWAEVPSERIADAAEQAGDGVVAVGGGSAIDLGKAISAEAELPLISVPTTYAGAEWTPYFGVRDPERKMRGGGAGAHLIGR